MTSSIWGELEARAKLLLCCNSMILNRFPGYKNCTAMKMQWKTWALSCLKYFHWKKSEKLSLIIEEQYLMLIVSLSVHGY